MGCCNERGVLRPLLSGSAASRNGDSASRYQNNGNNNSARYSRNKKKSGRKTRNKSANDISQRHISTNSEHDDDYDEFDDDDEDIILGYSGATSSWCCIFSEMWRKIGLLVWKNFLFRKRHYIVTALEIILPTLCAIILAAIKAEAGGHSHIDLTGNQTIVFPAIHEEDLTLLLSLKISCGNCIVAYAPDNDQSRQVIQELASSLPGTKIDWKPFTNEEEIEKLLASLSFNTTENGSLRAALVFENGLEPGSSSVSYKIRIVDEFHDTGLLFPWFQLPGPNTEHAKHYADTGFTGFQVLIDKILAKRFTGRPVSHSISLQPFPYPPFTLSFDFNMLYFILLPQLFVLGFIFMVPSIIRAVVSEKETGIRELLKLNGLRGWMQWMGWMINSLLILIISITIVIFLLFWTFDVGAGAVLVYSDPTVWWVVLFLFAMSASSFCFFISSFFIKPTLATTVGIILWLSSYYFFFVPLEKNYQSSSFLDKMTVALIPNMALHLAIKVMSALEGKAVGARWSNIAEPISSVDPLSLGHVILMFLLNTCMYMFLTVYVENVLPSEYGVRKPWYYIFQPSTYWRKGGIQSRPGTSSEQGDFDNNMPGFEIQPSDVTVGVEIKNLRKVFGRNKTAVAGVSAKMYDGEIFALLGHNGAGKTTTISMLTGLFAPSGGTATVNGYDITAELDAVRDNLGLCPQHNMLFDKLTVSEHLRFFGQLKGLTSSEATKEMKELLRKLQLTEKESTLSMALSGGQKRKLSLGIALIGGTKVVILDEPTSGMDPEARRAIWDLLLEMRGHRTILLTTHFMEEADVLGDRIGIMAAGKLQCCGTSMFLKKFYGTGYTLKLSVSDEAQQNVILSVIQNYISNALIKASHSTNVSELLITLPTETSTTSILSEMFIELTRSKRELGIKTMGLSLTTMDEVFLRVGELMHEHSTPETSRSSVEGTPETSHRVLDERMTLKKGHDRVVGLKLVKEQFLALLAKKYIYTLRKRKLMLSQLIIPVIILILAIWVSNKNFETPDQPPPLEIKLDSYQKPVTFATSTDPTFAAQLASVIGASYKPVPEGSSLLSTISDLGVSDLAAYRETHIIAAEANATNFNALFNTIPNHAAPLAINIASNTLLKNLDPTNNFNIRVKNHPLQSKMDALLEAAKPDPIFSQTVPFMFAVFMPIGLALLAASFIVFPVEEKLCNAKQLQMMTGVSPLCYWYSAFLWDFFLVFLVVCVMTACFPIFQSYSVFTSYGGAGVAFLILMVYGFSAISFSYLVSLYSSTVAGGFAFVSIIHVVSGMILCLLVHLMEIADLLTVAGKVRWIGRLFPTFGASISTMRFSEIASTNGRCNILSEEAKSLLCDKKITTVPSDYRECCENCLEFEDVKCFTPTSYITWEYHKHAFGTDVTAPGIGQELLYMILMAVIYQVILILLEYEVLQRILAMIFRTDSSVFDANINDEDVLAESQRVANMVTDKQVNDDALVVENFCKSYGSFAAVSKLSFGVHHGECFGLLGVNGAGKTTTFRMLTGDEFRSHGNAYAYMNTLDRDRKPFLSNIGYCPQFDGVVGVLTGREMLQLFCRLRGVPGKYGKSEAEKWLKRLGLLESGDVQCRKYSGGMKRRLSVAMAMIGDPPLLLLDEPTSGVDPVSRRQFWDVLSSVRDSGQAIILTSHSMEECEALCSRLGIMVNGQLQCLGGVQHLKSKFAQGYSLSLKLRPLIPVDSEELSRLSDDINKMFNPCTLKDKHQNVLQYQLHNTAIPWDVLFKTMEDLKTTYEGIIEDYSVNETSLEEVFLSFARKQYGSRKADVSLLKRIITCQLVNS